MGLPDSRNATTPSDGTLYHEDWRQRHNGRKEAANQNERVVRQWCNENNVELVIGNNGHHWSLYRPPRRPNIVQPQWAEWWPSSAKLVIAKRWKEGIHCHDVIQLINELSNFLLRKKESKR